MFMNLQVFQKGNQVGSIIMVRYLYFSSIKAPGTHRNPFPFLYVQPHRLRADAGRKGSWCMGGEAAMAKQRTGTAMMG